MAETTLLTQDFDAYGGAVIIDFQGFFELVNADVQGSGSDVWRGRVIVSCYRNGTLIEEWPIGILLKDNDPDPDEVMSIPELYNTVRFLDAPAAGVQTYVIKARCDRLALSEVANSVNVTCHAANMVITELKR